MKLFKTTYDQAGNIDRVIPNKYLVRIGIISLSVLALTTILLCCL